MLIDEKTLKRFADKYIRKGDCWIWTASKNPKGYGYFGLGRDVELAHRASYMIHVGEIPNGCMVLHQCDEPSCVNPHHLRIGSGRDNTSDMAKKGRGFWQKLPRPPKKAKPGRARGSRVGVSRLTEDDVRQIRARHEAGETQVSLAQSFGVTHVTIGHIVRREHWKHV